MKFLLDHADDFVEDVLGRFSRVDGVKGEEAREARVLAEHDLDFREIPFPLPLQGFLCGYVEQEGEIGAGRQTDEETFEGASEQAPRSEVRQDVRNIPVRDD